MTMTILISGDDLEAIAAQIDSLTGLFRPEWQVGTATAEQPSHLEPVSGSVSIPTAVPNTEHPVPAQPVELDADGQPWNAEIHSGRQSRKADGRWTLKRNADKQRVAAIYAAHTAATALATPAVPAAATGPDPFAPVTGVAPPVPTDPLAACIATATQCLASTEDPATKGIIGQRINAIMAASGLVGLPQLEANEQLAPTVLVGLQALAVECGITC